MGFRYLPVRERALNAIVNHLKNISQSNGFNFDVKKVSRTRQIPRPTESVELFLMIGKTEHIVFNNRQDKDTMNIEVWFTINNDSRKQEDTIYNMFVSDLLKAFQCYNIQDDTHPTSPKEVEVETIYDQPFYAEGIDSLIQGKFVIEASYTRMIDNPNLWDMEDVAVIKED